MTDIDWSKAPADATHARVEEGRVWIWRKKTAQGDWMAWHYESWNYIAEPTPELYIARPVSWTGEGLPPVGLQVENNFHGPVMVLAHGVFRGQEVVICQGDDTIVTCTPDTLSPFRTAEQIAAEQRRVEIKHIQAASCGDAMPAICESAAAALYDAGYRKQEQSK